MNQPLHSWITATVLSFAFLSSSQSFAVSYEEQTQVFFACDEDKERWNYRKGTTAQEKESFELLFDRSQKIEAIFQKGFDLNRKGRNAEVRELGAYMQIRAIYRSGAIHAAHDYFQDLIAYPIKKNHPIGARFAALDCVIRIHNKYPSFKWKPEAVKRTGEILKLYPTLKPLDKDKLYRALVNRAIEVSSEGEESEFVQILEFLKGSSFFESFVSALHEQRKGNYDQAIANFKKAYSIEKTPEFIQRNWEAALLLWARDYYEKGMYKEAIEVLRKIPKSSNYLVQSLTDLSWAFLSQGKKNEALGSAGSIQKSALSRTFAPEAPLVMAISFFELCQYPKALKGLQYFRQKYQPVLQWAQKSLKPETDFYSLYIGALENKKGTPSQIVMEWLRSPIVGGLQAELNLLIDEQKTLPGLVNKGDNDVLLTDEGSRKMWKNMIEHHLKRPDKEIPEVMAKINKALKSSTDRMIEDATRVSENISLLEIEIYDAAGEDMVWKNVNNDYAQFLSKQKAEKSKGTSYQWGSLDINSKREEVWEDELDWFAGNVVDECKRKEDFEKSQRKKTEFKPVDPTQVKPE